MKPKPISRQRKWQLRRMADGMCKLCATPRDDDDPTYCPVHRDDYNARQRQYMAMTRANLKISKMGKPC
jgi:hypothetical protein